MTFFEFYLTYFRAMLPFYISCFQGAQNDIIGETLNTFFLNAVRGSVALLHPLKTWENQRFTDVFRGYRNRILTWNRLQHETLLSFDKFLSRLWHYFEKARNIDKTAASKYIFKFLWRFSKLSTQASRNQFFLHSCFYFPGMLHASLCKIPYFLKQLLLWTFAKI